MEMTKPAPPLATSSSRPTLQSRFGGLWRAAGMIPIFVLLIVCASMFVNGFASSYNMQSLALSVVTVGLLACTMMFCLAAGDFDLSVGSVLAMSEMLAAIVANKTGSYAAGCAAGILAGGIVGLLNGTVISVVGINALITTLATMQIVRGLAYILGNGISVPVSVQSAQLLGRSSFLGLSTPVWILIAVVLVFGILLNFTTFGRNTLAVGGNSEAARLAGIRVWRIKLIIFVLQGMMAGFAGAILASRLGLADPKDGQGLELKVISACVLGGVSLTGGIASISGAIIGVLIMGTVQNIMDLLIIPWYWQFVVSGAILLTAVMLDRLKQK
jgi:L-arabinose transport system permease protein